MKRALHFHLVFHSIACEIPCEKHVNMVGCKRQVNIPVKMDVKNFYQVKYHVKTQLEEVSNNLKINVF